MWKPSDGRGTGWNTLALCVGYHFIFVIWFHGYRSAPLVLNSLAMKRGKVS